MRIKPILFLLFLSVPSFAMENYAVEDEMEEASMDIRSIPPGSTIKISSGRLLVRANWDFSEEIGGLPWMSCRFYLWNETPVDRRITNVELKVDRVRVAELAGNNYFIDFNHPVIRKLSCESKGLEVGKISVYELKRAFSTETNATITLALPPPKSSINGRNTKELEPTGSDADQPHGVATSNVISGQ